MVNARRDFEKTKNEELNAMYDIWNKFETDIVKVRKNITDVVKELQPLKDEVESINELLSKTNSYQINDLLKTVNELQSALSYNSETGKILKFLFKTYKKEEK